MRSEMFLLGGLLVLAGCGAGGDNASEVANAANGAAVEDVAAAPAVTEPKVDCDSVKGQTAPQGQPADDILGVRPGMTLDEARNVLQCKNASYAINTRQSTIGIANGGQMSRVDLSADTGLDKVNVWLVGPAGGERVIHVERAIEYGAGKELPIENVLQELTKKYGAFDARYGNQNGLIVRSRDGQRMTADNSSYGECSQHNIHTDRVLPCLNVVTYELRASSENPALAQRFGVSVTSQARTAEMAQLGEQKQAADVEKAKEKAAQQGLDL